MIKYQETLIRPPSEAESLIFQVTLGCTDNQCAFCPAYKDKKFHIRDIKEIKAEIEYGSREFPDTRKVFLADGDAIAIPQPELIEILTSLNKAFPRLTRIGIYGSAKSLTTKTLEELKELHKFKLGILYLGIETGDPEVYAMSKKWGTPEANIKECLKVKEAGIKLNTTIILGLGGIKNSANHVKNTANVLNKIKPNHIAALTLMLAPGTILYKEQRSGNFVLPEPMDLVKELYYIVSGLDNFDCLFFSNHASNYFAIQARFPAQKSFIQDSLKELIQSGNEKPLRPEISRGL